MVIIKKIMVEVEILLEMREREKEIQDSNYNSDCNSYRLVELINEFFKISNLNVRTVHTN